MTDDVVVLRRTLPATPERVFAAWTDPQLLARWMSPVGQARVEAEARIGGRLRVVMVGEGREIEHVGEYTEVAPPHRLVFSWQSAYTADRASRVIVELRGVAGGTELTLRHELLPPAAVESHRGGWLPMLDRLAALLHAPQQEARDVP